MTGSGNRPRWTGWDLGAVYVASQVAGVVLVLAVAFADGLLGKSDLAHSQRSATVAVYLLSSLLLLALECGMLAVRKATELARDLYRGVRGFAPILLWGILGGIVVKIATDAATWLESLFVHHIEDNNPLVTDPGAFAATPVLVGLFVSVVAIAPLAEELFYRGLLFSLFRRHGFWIAAVGSAVLFGAAHLSLTLFFPLAVTGFGLAVIYEKTRTLWASTIAHAVFNGIALVATVATWRT